MPLKPRYTYQKGSSVITVASPSQMSCDFVIEYLPSIVFVVSFKPSMCQHKQNDTAGLQTVHTTSEAAVVTSNSNSCWLACTGLARGVRRLLSCAYIT